MKMKGWVWTCVLAFLGYAVSGKGAIENGVHELVGTIIGALLGFAIGWGLQWYDSQRAHRN